MEACVLCMGFFFFRKKNSFYSEELKTQQPKPYGMVERVARSGRLIVDGHHDLETDLRNESGKVEHKTLWVSRIPPASFFFRKFNIAYNEGKWNSLGYARRWLRRHNHANSSMVEHSKQFERRAFEAHNPFIFRILHTPYNEGSDFMKLLSKAKTHIQDWASTYLLEKIYASQRVFLDSIGLRHRDVDLEIGLEAAHLMKYCPELDCMIPRIIDMRYEQKNGNESASVWTTEDEQIWQQIIKA